MSKNLIFGLWFGVGCLVLLACKNAVNSSNDKVNPSFNDAAFTSIPVTLRPILEDTTQTASSQTSPVRNLADLLDQGHYVVFEVWYFNTAWSYTSEGMFIDSAGRVFSFVQGSQIDTEPPYTTEALASKYGHRIQNIGQVNSDDLTAQMDLIPLLQDVERNDSHLCFDCGILTYMAYHYDHIEQTYEPIMLYQTSLPYLKDSVGKEPDLVVWLNQIARKNGIQLSFLADIPDNK